MRIDHRVSQGVVAATVPLGPVAVLLTVGVEGPLHWWQALAAILVAPTLGCLLGTACWPNTTRARAALIALTSSAALWVSLVFAGGLFYLSTLCGSQFATPALILGWATYVVTAVSLGDTPGRATLAWPASAALGVGISTIALALGPHGHCYL